MADYALVHSPSGRTVARVRRVDGWWAKGWGVLGHRALPVGEGLWLLGVASVHTAFVRFPLDLLFLDRELRSVRLAPSTPPWRWLIRAPGASHTLELGVGTLAQCVPQAQVGDAWELRLADAGERSL